MHPKVDSSTGSTTPGETRAELEATLRRIDLRLERLEQAFEPIVQATTAAPALTSTAVDVLDEWALQHDDLDARLRTLSELLERLTRPEALAPLMAFVELTEQVKPGFSASRSTRKRSTSSWPSATSTRISRRTSARSGLGAAKRCSGT